MTTTVKAPTNIAILKYWGKNPKFEKYHIPSKSSISFTVDKLFTKTTVSARKGSGNVEFRLNGKLITPEMKEYEYIDDFMKKIGKIYPFVKNYDYKIISENNFPTAAGFASSASGFAALVKAMVGEINEFKDIKEDDKKISALARLGSGSATRSIPKEGGFVIWYRGVDPKEEVPLEKALEKSYAETLLPPDHWPELRIIYSKVKKKEKKVKSRAGMKTSVNTDPLYWDWIELEEKEYLNKMIDLVKEKDFPKLAEYIMRASNNLHSTCLRTMPPIQYLNDTSWDIIFNVHELNKEEIKAAYTFDAGPNAVVFTLDRYLDEVKAMLESIVGKENIVITKPGIGAHYVEEHFEE